MLIMSKLFAVRWISQGRRTVGMEDYWVCGRLFNEDAHRAHTSKSE